jgi:hypothetical protein
MPLKPEERLQVAVLQMAKEVIMVPFRLRAFDRARDHSGRAHMMQANKGLRSGTPDLELIVAGRSINTELKSPGTKHLASHQPTPAQEEEMRLLRAAGAHAACAWSCVEVLAHWRAAGVPLSPVADRLALDRDLRMEGRAAIRAGAAPKSYRPGRAVRKRGLRETGVTITETREAPHG